jgi:hypothetical protein
MGPKKRLVLAATILIVAASLAAARPAVGIDHAAHSVSVVKLLGRS